MDILKMIKKISPIQDGSALSENELNTLIKQYPFASALYAMRTRAQVESGRLSPQDLSHSALHFSNSTSFINSCIAVNKSELKDRFNQKAASSVEEQIEVTNGSEQTIVGEHPTQVEDDISNLAKVKEQPADQNADIDSVETNKDGYVETIASDIAEESHEKIAEPQVLEAEADKDESISVSKNSLFDLAHLSEYGSWLLQLKNRKPKQSIGELDDVTVNESIEPPRDAKIASKRSEYELSETTQSAQKVDVSSRLNDQIASESLANLLAEQGYHKKAIDMYKKLSLIIPEKSTYFATQIEKIKRK